MPEKSHREGQAPIDPSHEQTESHRRLAAFRNEYLALEQGRLTRLSEVMNEFPLYTAAVRLDLAYAAVDCAIASMAGAEPSGEVESLFYRIVDWMYVSTDHAVARFSDAEAQTMAGEAAAAREGLGPPACAVMRTSVSRLRGLPEESPYHVLFKTLWVLRAAPYLDHAGFTDLRDLIMYCVMFCKASDCYRLGVASMEGAPAILEVLRMGKLIGDIAVRMMTAVNESIREGKLVWRDNRIVEVDRSSGAR